MSRQISQPSNTPRPLPGTQIKYKAGYKYQIVEDGWLDIGLCPAATLRCGPYITLTTNGVLHCKAGYCFDGPSGPTFDTDNFMRGSLWHDLGYQLLRNGFFEIDTSAEWIWGHERFRLFFDRLLRDHCREDGMSAIRAWWVYQGVRKGGEGSAALGEREVFTAP